MQNILDERRDDESGSRQAVRRGLRWRLSALDDKLGNREVLHERRLFRGTTTTDVTAIIAITDHVAARISKSALDGRVLAALAKVPRHEFVPVELQQYAYLADWLR